MKLRAAGAAILDHALALTSFLKEPGTQKARTAALSLLGGLADPQGVHGQPAGGGAGGDNPHPQGARQGWQLSSELSAHEPGGPEVVWRGDASEAPGKMVGCQNL